MASEMFIISTKYSTAMTEYIVDRKNGYYIEVDQTSICDSIRWCLRNRDIVSDAAKENKIIAKNSLMNSVNASAYLIKFI